jgi:glycosyltransferase involved in cell wall biosynthesis
MPRFSVIITCYNQRDFIKEAVDSVLAQNCRDREIIVVNDCSTDGSNLVLERYAEAITLITLLTNEGAVGARNRGAAIARGDFLVFLDGDDRLLPWALDVYGRVADLKTPKLILARIHFFKGSLPAETTGAHPGEIKVVEYEDYFKKSRTYRASASAMVIDRLAFHSVGGWTAGTFPADDQDLLLKLGCSGRTLQIVTPETSAYRVHEGNATRHVRSLVDSLHFLLARERDGHYPGGRNRQFERRAVIGGVVFFTLKRTWRSRLYGRSLKLLAAGWPLVIAAIMRKGVAGLTGLNQHQEETLQRVSQPK